MSVDRRESTLRERRLTFMMLGRERTTLSGGASRMRRGTLTAEQGSVYWSPMTTPATGRGVQGERFPSTRARIQADGASINSIYCKKRHAISRGRKEAIAPGDNTSTRKKTSTPWEISESLPSVMPQNLCIYIFFVLSLQFSIFLLFSSSSSISLSSSSLSHLLLPPSLIRV